MVGCVHFWSRIALIRSLLTSKQHIWLYLNPRIFITMKTFHFRVFLEIKDKIMLRVNFCCIYGMILCPVYLDHFSTFRFFVTHLTKIMILYQFWWKTHYQHLILFLEFDRLSCMWTVRWECGVAPRVELRLSRRGGSGRTRNESPRPPPQGNRA